VEDPVAHRITVAAPRIQVSAAYRDSPAPILAILSSAGLPPPGVSNPAKMAGRLRGGPPALPGSATDGSGFGFDTCSAPSARLMHAWLLHSHYRGIGVYIGGSDRACAQPALTAGWVSREAAAGWHFIPLYVGPQVSFGEVSAPARQAIAAAQDAAVQTRLLGFGPGSPIYYDMEAYAPDRSRLALKFFSVWRPSYMRSDIVPRFTAVRTRVSAIWAGTSTMACTPCPT
jgi:Rv2525c-like, glycoside hydrolase-like domain